MPGTVRGLALAHQKFGKLPWKDVVAPAVKLAEDGFVIDACWPPRSTMSSASSDEFPELHPRIRQARRQADWKAGDRLVQRPGRTLRLIAEQGPDAFYTGSIADLIAAEMKAGGGLITKADLAAYQAKERKPIHGTYRGYDVYGPPPPSSGGTCLVEMLNVLENFDLKKARPLVAEDAAPDGRGHAASLLRSRPLPRRRRLRADSGASDEQGVRP